MWFEWEYLLDCWTLLFFFLFSFLFIPTSGLGAEVRKRLQSKILTLRSLSCSETSEKAREKAACNGGLISGKSCLWFVLQLLNLKNEYSMDVSFCYFLKILEGFWLESDICFNGSGNLSAKFLKRYYVDKQFRALFRFAYSSERNSSETAQRGFSLLSSRRLACRLKTA